MVSESMGIVENRKRRYAGISQGVIKQIDSIRQSTYKRRGDTTPSVEHRILPTPIVKFSRESTPIEHRVPYQLRKVVYLMRRELEYMKLAGSTTSAAYRKKDRAVADSLRENVAGSITLDDLWDSLGYGWTRNFVEKVLGLSYAQINTYMVRLGQLSMG